MSVLKHLASSFGRRDEVPNVEHALQLVAKRDTKGSQELVDTFAHKEKPLRHDALDLLEHKDSCMAWGSLTALGRLAPLCQATARFLELVDANMRRPSLALTSRANGCRNYGILRGLRLKP
ncbi:MAG: hypothetical protein QM477_10635 [Planctomycetota bacterium]